MTAQINSLNCSLITIALMFSYIVQDANKQSIAQIIAWNHVLMSHLHAAIKAGSVLFANQGVLRPF